MSNLTMNSYEVICRQPHHTDEEVINAMAYLLARKDELIKVWVENSHKQNLATQSTASEAIRLRQEISGWKEDNRELKLIIRKLKKKIRILKTGKP